MDKHLVITILAVVSVGTGLFASGWALASGVAWLAVVAGLCGGAGLMAMGLFIYYFGD
jgi:hypothetical protein